MSNDLHLDKADLQVKYKNTPGVIGFGVGDNCVIIYVLNDDVANQLPKEHNGKPIQIIVVGDVTAYDD